MARVEAEEPVTLAIPRALVAQSITQLQTAGMRSSEHVLLWLGRRRGEDVLAMQMYVPEQVASYDFFNIPPHSMRALLKHLRENELMIAAQVHSHPAEAFHSAADDRWAIVRHEGAFSIVLPYFAAESTVENFLTTSATFTLNSRNQWREISVAKLDKYVRLQ